VAALAAWARSDRHRQSAGGAATTGRHFRGSPGGAGVGGFYGAAATPPPSQSRPRRPRGEQQPGRHVVTLSIHPPKATPTAGWEGVHWLLVPSTPPMDRRSVVVHPARRRLTAPLSRATLDFRATARRRSLLPPGGGGAGGLAEVRSRRDRKRIDAGTLLRAGAAADRAPSVEIKPPPGRT